MIGLNPFIIFIKTFFLAVLLVCLTASGLYCGDNEREDIIVVTQKRLSEPELLLSKFLKAIKLGQKKKAFSYCYFKYDVESKVYKRIILSWLNNREKIKRFEFNYKPEFFIWENEKRKSVIEDDARFADVRVDFVYDKSKLTPKLLRKDRNETIGLQFRLERIGPGWKVLPQIFYG